MPLLTRPSIDWKNPAADYDTVLMHRLEVLDRIRGDAQPELIVADMKALYREYPAQMICDWGVTVDPRNVERGLPAVMPFIPFDAQVELIDTIVEQWRGLHPDWQHNHNLLIDKSRDMGVTWCFMGLAVCLCILYDDLSIGTGSRKWELVEDLGNLDAILPKGRVFLRYLPTEFRGGWIEKKHTKEGQIYVPDTRSLIDGEAGDDIGRGGRKSLYGVDEAAHLTRPESIDASLANNTNCRIEFSSVKGMSNPFARRRHDGSTRVLSLDWRQDPRKDQTWYDNYLGTWGPTLTAQEVDRNYAASVDGVIIPGLWVQAAVDAHIKLGIQPSGIRWGGFDVADLGKDKNAFCARHGVLVESVEQWAGKDAGDPQGSVAHVFRRCDELRLSGFSYDVDGMGGPSIRGPAQRLNAERKTRLQVVPFRGGASGDALYQPEAFVRGEDGRPLDRKNKDYFMNYKAQSYIALRYRFLQTYRAVAKQDKTVDMDDIISLNSKMQNLSALIAELSQPVMKDSATGKLLVDKTPDGMKSPNLSDAVMMCFAPRRMGLNISDDLLDSI